MHTIAQYEEDMSQKCPQILTSLAVFTRFSVVDVTCRAVITRKVAQPPHTGQRCSNHCSDIPSQYFPGQSGPLSLAIPRRVGTMSTGNCCGHRCGRNGKFCI